MIAMPTKYPGSYIHCTLGLNTNAFKRHMRMTNIQEVTLRVAQDAYSTGL